MVEIASGVPLVWARRDGAGVVPVSVGAPGVEVSVALASAGSVWLVPVDIAGLSSTVSAVALVLVPSSALPASPFEESACACCSAVVRGCMASAMAATGIVALTMDAHAIAQSR